MNSSIERWGPRIAARKGLLVAAGLLSGGYWLLAGLPAVWALVGFAASLVWAGARPVTETGGASIDGWGRAGQGSLGPSAAGKLGVDGWQRLAAGLPVPAVVVSTNLSVLAVNSAATELLGLNVGQNLYLVLRSPELLAAIEQARRTGLPQSAELHIAVPIERALSVRVGPILIEESASVGFDMLVSFIDRTEAQQLAQLRADFVANASHELRTPLASVKGFIETLQGAAKDDPAARERFLGIMHEQASRMSRLIEDLLSLSRIEMKEHLVPRDRVDVAEVAEDLGKALEPLALKSGRQLSISIEARPAVVRGDRDELAQVIQNLVQNAIKYGKQAGKVELKVAREGARITVAVTDDGIGIAPEHLPRLTERFYRVSAKASRERGGTGLGLAIVKHIVNRHRGELKIESVLGKGSTFAVLLPQEDAAS